MEKVVKSNKASLSVLEQLHNAVANQLASNLDDPKVLAQAISFLKNNSITVDLQESKPLQNVFDTVNNLISKPTARDSGKDAVQLLLEDIS